ncbi:MAG: DUF3800 domain-containing protein [Terriglobales bacterium]
MLLLYVDESGNPDDTTKHFVLGGLAIHEGDVDPLRRRVEGVLRRHLHPHLLGLEVHAHSIRTGVGPWRGVAPLPKAAIPRDLARVLGSPSSTRGYGLFAVVRSPGAVAAADPLQRCFEELLLRFNAYLHRRHAAGADDFGLVVADKAKYETILQPVVARWRATGTRFGRLRRVVEVPFFVDSSATRLIQLADLVSYAVYRHYSVGDSSLLGPMLPAFDSDGGVMHGLVHLVRNYRSCPCPGCVSRVAVRPASQLTT